MSDRIVTCIQERLDNSILTVRLDGKVLGRVLQDRPHEWVLVMEPPQRPKFSSLHDAVLALLPTARSDSASE